MTWLRGTTTWGAVEHLLTQLACGEVADDYSTIVATGSRWVRESATNRTVTDGVTTNGSTTFTSTAANFVATDVGALLIAPGVTLGTTIASVTDASHVVLSAAATASATGVSAQITTNAIRTPSSKDVSTGDSAGRTGYWLNVGNGNGPNQPLSAGGQTICKMVAPFTTAPSGTYPDGRWMLTIVVLQANTVPGDYSSGGCYVGVNIHDALTGQRTNWNTYVPSASGLIQLPSNYGGASVQITDPSGLLKQYTTFVRGFSSTYLYGIDIWPMWYRSSVASPTFSTPPPGTAGTDYDVVSLTHGNWQNLVYGVAPNDAGMLYSGLGIKTATGLGSLYTVSFPMSLAKARIFTNASASGVLSLDYGQARRDLSTTPVTYKNLGGIRVPAWCQPFQTANSVSTSSLVQYWMSVTPDGLVVILNGDPGATGKLSTAYLCSFLPTDPTYDVFPMSFNYGLADYTSDNGSDYAYTCTQYEYWVNRRRQDGSEGRDWQTRWMRGEYMASGRYVGNQPVYLLSVGNNSSGSNNPTASPVTQNKPAQDGKWWLYGAQYVQSDSSYNSRNQVTAPTPDDQHFIRATRSARWYFIPDTGWNSGDELIDSGSGTKYLLLKPDFAATDHWRSRYAANQWLGGVAIAEI